MHRAIVYGSVATARTASEMGENPTHNMRWTVAVRSAESLAPGTAELAGRKIQGDVVGGATDLSYMIKKVSFKLHDSYPNPLRVVDQHPFELHETGWGEFILNIKIHFRPDANEKPLQLQHPLKLHPWPNSDSSLPSPAIPFPNPPLSSPPDPLFIHSWQYDEIIFTEPMPAFYHILLKNPPPPLPLHNRFPPELVPQLGIKGGQGEFSLEIAQNERAFLDASHLRLLIEIDRLRGQISADERQLNLIKKSLAMPSSIS